MRKVKGIMVLFVLDLYRFLEDLWSDLAAIIKKHKSCVKQANKQHSSLGKICDLHTQKGFKVNNLS